MSNRTSLCASHVLASLVLLIAAAGCFAAKKAADSETRAQSVGVSGGTVALETITLDIPPGALTSDQPITIEATTIAAPDGYTGLSPVFEFGPDGLVFEQPVTVAMDYDASETDPVIFWSNSSGGYDPLPTTLANGRATAQVMHFSKGFVAKKLKETPPGDAKAITALSFVSPAETATVNEADKTIFVTVPHGTDVTALVAAFTTTGQSVKVGDVEQASGATANNFSSPVSYVVTAADKSTATYVVTVTIAPEVVLGSTKAITAFSFGSPAATGTINEAGKTIAVSVPTATGVTGLVATFATNGNSVKVAGIEQVSGVTMNDFTSPVIYSVTAADSSTAEYTVTVTKGPAAPTVSWPLAGGYILPRLVVQGSAVANATINVSVMYGSSPLVQGTGTADASGVFNFSVFGQQMGQGTALSMLVTQTVAAQVSPAATVPVFQGAPASLVFGVSGQTSGSTAGTGCYAVVFPHGSTTLPLDSHRFTETAGADAAPFTWTFSLPAAPSGLTGPVVYDFLAYRDTDGDGLFTPGEPATSSGLPTPHAIVPGSNSSDINQWLAP